MLKLCNLGSFTISVIIRGNAVVVLTPKIWEYCAPKPLIKMGCI